VTRAGLLLALGAVISASPCLGQSFSIIDRPDLEEYVFFTWDVLHVDGRIEDGLTERISSEFGGDLRVLSLNSKGGDFDEAIELAGYLAKNSVQTVLLEGAVCESACAIVFMAGRSPSAGAPAFPSRHMHVTARLGFHSPVAVNFKLPKGDELLTRQEALKWANEKYELAIHQLGRLLTAPATSVLRWPPSLLGEMLLTPGEPGSFRYIETIDDAGRWNIGLMGVPDPDPDLANKVTMFTACENMYRWSDEEVWYSYFRVSGDPDDGASGSDWVGALVQQLWPNELAVFRYEVMVDWTNAVACEFAKQDGSWTIDGGRGPPRRLGIARHGYLPPEYKYRSDTQLADLN
jgi:hypothetical protein